MKEAQDSMSRIDPRPTMTGATAHRDRMRWLHQYTQRLSVPNQSQLADIARVASEQAQRDLDASVRDRDTEISIDRLSKDTQRARSVAPGLTPPVRPGIPPVSPVRVARWSGTPAEMSMMMGGGGTGGVMMGGGGGGGVMMGGGGMPGMMGGAYTINPDNPIRVLIAGLAR